MAVSCVCRDFEFNLKNLKLQMYLRGHFKQSLSLRPTWSTYNSDDLAKSQEKALSAAKSVNGMATVRDLISQILVHFAHFQVHVHGSMSCWHGAHTPTWQVSVYFHLSLGK